MRGGLNFFRQTYSLIQVCLEARFAENQESYMNRLVCGEVLCKSFIQNVSAIVERKVCELGEKKTFVKFNKLNDRRAMKSRFLLLEPIKVYETCDASSSEERPQKKLIARRNLRKLIYSTAEV